MLSYAQLKKNANEYTWQLYMYNLLGIPTDKNMPHKFLNINRNVEHMQSNAIRFEEGSWLYWPKASAVTLTKYLYNDTDIVMTIREKDCPVLSYHLRKIPV